LPSKTFSWKRLGPTATLVSNASGQNTVSVTSGSFTGNSINYVYSGGIVTGTIIDGGQVIFEEYAGTKLISPCTDILSTPAQPSPAGCLFTESEAAGQATELEINWEEANYTIVSAQGIPATVLGESFEWVKLSYHSDTNSWY
jgi:hypothetical protein